MAERRPPGFNVDLGFYDSAEVLSIPRKIRAAAVGVWTLCGCYAANKLSDGYVPAEALRDRGCTPAIRAALMATEPEPLWEDAGGGAIRFTRWAKWQRTAAEIKDYRAAEAERKRKAREAKKAARDGHVDDTCGLLHADVDATWSPDEPYVAGDMGDTSAPHNPTNATPTSGNAKTSGRTSAGRAQAVRPEDGDPKTETETETESLSGYVTEESSPNVGGDERGLSEPVEPSASRLVAALIPNTIPASVRTGLRIRASELMRADGLDSDTVAEALRRWLAKPGAGVGLLASLASDVVRERAAPTNVHALSAFERKKAANGAVFQALANEPNHLEIEP